MSVDNPEVEVLKKKLAEANEQITELHSNLARMEEDFVGDSLDGFFYDLIRDHLPVGVVEKLVQEAERLSGQDVHFTNQYLANYAGELRNRLGKVSRARAENQATDEVVEPALDQLSEKEVEIENLKSEVTKLTQQLKTEKDHVAILKAE